MTYKELVSKFREFALDSLRMKAIERYLHRIFENQKRINKIKNSMKTVEEGGEFDKPLKRLEYALSKLDAEDPDYNEEKEDLEKEIEEEKENIQTMTENNEKVIKEREDRIAELEEKIEKVSTGEIKIKHEKISGLAKFLCEKYAEKRASDIASETLEIPTQNESDNDSEDNDEEDED